MGGLQLERRGGRSIHKESAEEKITLRMFEKPIKIHDVLCVPKITYSTYIV